MGNVIVQPVGSRRQRKEFLTLPWTLYRGDPNWMPPLRQNVKELVGFARHPFYADAIGQTFLAYRDGVPVGRIEAIVNHAHNRRYDERRGFFGFFETIDDRQVAHALLETARSWLGEQGMTTVRGPINPSLNYEVGLLVDGFDRPPMFMMTYNPPHYAGHIESFGFEKSQDLYAFWGHVEMLRGLDKKLNFVIGEARERFGIVTRPMNARRFREEIASFLTIYNESLVGTWGFVPLSRGELDHMGAALKHLIIPELAIIAEIEGQPVGCTFCLPDYNPRIKAIDGRLFPFGFIRLLARKNRIPAVRVISTNVLPKYQGWGVGLVIVDALVPKILASGVQEAEFSWVLESNHLSRKSLERGGAIRNKTYRVYDRAI